MKKLENFVKKLPNLSEGQILDDEEMGQLEGGGPCTATLKKAVIICNTGPALVITPTLTPTPTPTPTPKPVIPPTTTLISL